MLFLHELLGELTNLEYVDISNNQLESTIPSTLGKLTHLKELDFSGNALRGSVPTEISELSNLSTSVVVSHTKAETCALR